jgi:site-specific DNA-methyltransferase (adenine-specific)
MTFSFPLLIFLYFRLFKEITFIRLKSEELFIIIINMDDYKIINGKCEEVIPSLENNSIDLVITSPPYNVDLGNNKFNKSQYDLYNDNREHTAYIDWLKTIFGTLYPKLKKGARVVINVGDGKNGRVPTHSDIIQFMTHELNYLPMANIIWQKSQIGNRTAWGSFCSPSAPSFPKPFEYIMVFSKETIKLQEEGETDLKRQEFIDWSLSVWTMTPETKLKQIGHPAAFPIQLPYRAIKMLSWKNATVLDPFSGSGTTGVACTMLKRKYIGIELSKKYCDIAIERIEVAKEQNQDIFNPE